MEDLCVLEIPSLFNFSKWKPDSQYNFFIVEYHHNRTWHQWTTQTIGLFLYICMSVRNKSNPYRNAIMDTSLDIKYTPSVYVVYGGTAQWYVKIQLYWLTFKAVLDTLTGIIYK